MEDCQQPAMFGLNSRHLRCGIGRIGLIKAALLGAFEECGVNPSLFIFSKTLLRRYSCHGLLQILEDFIRTLDYSEFHKQLFQTCSTTFAELASIVYYWGSSDDDVLKLISFHLKVVLKIISRDSQTVIFDGPSFKFMTLVTIYKEGQQQYGRIRQFEDNSANELLKLAMKKEGRSGLERAFCCGVFENAGHFEEVRQNLLSFLSHYSEEFRWILERYTNSKCTNRLVYDLYVAEYKEFKTLAKQIYEWGERLGFKTEFHDLPEGAKTVCIHRTRSPYLIPVCKRRPRTYAVLRKPSEKNHSQLTDFDFLKPLRK